MNNLMQIIMDSAEAQVGRLEFRRLQNEAFLDFYKGNHQMERAGDYPLYAQLYIIKRVFIDGYAPPDEIQRSTLERHNRKVVANAGGTSPKTPRQHLEEDGFDHLMT